jgi:hypothetical protein
MKTIHVVAIVAASVLPWATPTLSAPKAAAKGVSLTVKVSNGRSSPVTMLSFVPQGTEAGGNLLKAPLAPGKSVAVVVTAKKGQCLFDVAGTYADEVEVDVSGVDLCKDKKLALVD